MRNFLNLRRLLAGTTVTHGPLVPPFSLPFAHILLVGWMPSALKVWFYRRRGHVIGDNVRMGFGAVVVARRACLGAGTSIGLLSVVRADEVDLGEDVTIARLTVVDTNRLRMGDGSRLNNQVVVGGMRSPSSELVMGMNSMIMEWSFVNTTRPVHMGDDSAVGGHGLLFTHGVWSDAFQGYPVSYGPITIGDHVWIPWRVTILPDVTIGDGAVIGGSSVVTRDIPPGVLAAGTPAKVLREAEEFVSPLADPARAQLLTRIVHELGEWLRFNDIPAESMDHAMTVQLPDGRAGTVHTLDPDGHALPDTAEVDVLVSLAPLSAGDRARLAKRGTGWIDLASKERSRDGSPLHEETASFLRRFGVRLRKAS